VNNISVKKQSGAALVVGLIVLLILTILGLSSMNSMTSELKIAANSQDHNSAFQAAAAGIAQMRNDPAIPWTFLTGTVNQTYTALDNSATADAVASYADCRNVTIGYSLSGSWKGVVHEIRSAGSALNSNGDPVSENTQVLGIETVRPGC